MAHVCDICDSQAKHVDEVKRYHVLLVPEVEVLNPQRTRADLLRHSVRVVDLCQGDTTCPAFVINGIVKGLTHAKVSACGERGADKPVGSVR